MNEFTGMTQIGVVQKRMENLVNPREPKQKEVRHLNIPLDRFATRKTSTTEQEQTTDTEEEQTTENSSKSRKINIPLRELQKYLRDQLPKNPRNEELQKTVGFEFSDKEMFKCTEYTEVVNFSVSTDQLLPNQHPEKLNRRLGRLATVTKADAARIINDLASQNPDSAQKPKKSENDVSDEELLAIRQKYELPPTAEAIVKFYVHELPKPSEQVGQGMDLIVFGGGASDALSNIDFAGQLARELENNEQLKGKVGRIIVMPHLAGATKTGEPFNPAMTKDFGPAAKVMIQALKQAGITLSSELCLAGHSAGANMSILMAEGLVRSNPNLHPRLLLLEPAIGENPGINLRMAGTGIFDPLREARSRNEMGQRLNIVQSLQYTLRTVINGWVTQDGPAGAKILGELMRGSKPFDYMKKESTQAGFSDELTGGNPNIALLSADSSADARKFLVENNIPINIAYVTGSTTVDPLPERHAKDRKSLQDEYVRIQEQLESQLGLTHNELTALKKRQENINDQLSRNQAFFKNRADELFSPETIHSVTAVNGISHFDVYWDKAAVAKMLMATFD